MADPANTWCPWCLKPVAGSRCPDCHCSTVPEEEARLDGSARAGGMLNAPRYRVLGLLGQGAMGLVHKGYDRIRNRMVAIKWMTQGAGSDGGSRTPLQQRIVEASAVGRIRSPHVVEFLDFEISEDGIPCLVTALLKGEDLARRLERSPGHRLPWRDAVRIAREAAEGLAAAHREGVLHGDLKPSNLFLEAAPDGDQVRILDFGLALFRSGDQTADWAQAATIAGTFAYMAPELGYNRPPAERSDLYSLGIVLYEMLSGRVPWSGPPLAILARKATEEVPAIPPDCEVPEPLWRLIRELLQSDPSRRPGSAEEVAARLRSIGEGGMGDPVPSSDPSPALPAATGTVPRPRRPLVQWRFLLPAVLLLAVLGWGTSRLLASSAVSLREVRETCEKDRPVRVRASVRKAMGLPLGRFSLFQVADHTGDLWVFSMGKAPPEGSEVRVRGHAVPMDRLPSICEGNGWAEEACSSVLALARVWTGPCLLVEDLREE